MKANIQLHERAVQLCREHRRVEFALIEVLQEIESRRMYRAFECTSLFKYAVDILGLTESVAYAFILVARKASAVPELQQTLRAQSLTVRKALRTVSILNSSNASEIIEFAKTHTSRELDQEIARRQPGLPKRPSIRPISSEQMSLNMTLKIRVFQKLMRAQNLLGESDLEMVLENVLDKFLDKKDPVRKAERAKSRANRLGEKSAKRPSKTIQDERKNQPDRNSQPAKQAAFARANIAAHQRHEVHARDQGQCTYVDAHGRRCEGQRWLHLHHLKPVSLGGSNAPTNLRTLCAAHHDLVHQLSFELRSPQTIYSAS